jgi:hypothetical protein
VPVAELPQRDDRHRRDAPTAKSGASFQSPLQVQPINTHGCPVTANATGVSVTFTAPVSGPSGTLAVGDGGGSVGHPIARFRAELHGAIASPDETPIRR